MILRKCDNFFGKLFFMIRLKHWQLLRANHTSNWWLAGLMLDQRLGSG